MRILIAHNYYQQAGGEDSVVAAERGLLEQHGHDVAMFTRDNQDIEGLNALRLGSELHWSKRTIGDLRLLFNQSPVDIVHAHNTFPLISPSLYWAAASSRIPVVQTLHNFRLVCPQAMLLRNGNSCEACVGKIPWRAALHACYRNSRGASAALASALTMHRIAGTFKRKVARYVALTQYARQKLVDGGLPPNKTVVKGNFVDLPAPREGQSRNGALFVGRLSHEKGVEVLARAVGRVPSLDLTVVGDGPAKDVLAQQRGVRWLGQRPAENVYEEMRAAQFLVMPSIWPEGFPRTLVESFACGLPVIASRLGSMAELIDHGRNGLLFEPNSAQDLTHTLEWAARHPQEMAAMGETARRTFEQHHTPDTNYQELMKIYADALAAVPRPTGSEAEVGGLPR